MDVNIIKLANGEEIIGKTTFTDEGAAIVEDALQIMLMPSEDGRINMGLIPFMPYAESFFVYTTNIIAIGTPNKDFLDKYTRATSKIVMPSSSLVSVA